VAGFIFFGMMLGFLGIFVAAVVAVIAKSAWWLLLCPALALVGGIIGFIIQMLEGRSGS
jgi:hypothetical protein